MTQDITYREKFAILKNWIPTIMDSVRKDLKRDHLRKDPLFVKQYLNGANPQKVENQELVEGYTRAIQSEEKGEEIAEFIASRWLLHHSDVYNYFEQRLSQISPDFTQIKEIEEKAAKSIINDALPEFGAPNVYLFCQLNCVALPEKVMVDLEKSAAKEQKEYNERVEKEAEAKSVEDMKRHYEEQLARIADKFEKKIIGLEKKYINDTETLKKQISTLQRKLNAQAGV